MYPFQGGQFISGKRDLSINESGAKSAFNYSTLQHWSHISCRLAYNYCRHYLAAQHGCSINIECEIVANICRSGWSYCMHDRHRIMCFIYISCVKFIFCLWLSYLNPWMKDFKRHFGFMLPCKLPTLFTVKSQITNLNFITNFACTFVLFTSF